MIALYRCSQNPLHSSDESPYQVNKGNSSLTCRVFTCANFMLSRILLIMLQHLRVLIKGIKAFEHSASGSVSSLHLCKSVNTK